MHSTESFVVCFLCIVPHAFMPMPLLAHAPRVLDASAPLLTAWKWTARLSRRSGSCSLGRMVLISSERTWRCGGAPLLTCTGVKAVSAVAAAVLLLHRLTSS